MASRARGVREICRVFSRSFSSVSPYKKQKWLRPVFRTVSSSPASVNTSGIRGKDWDRHVRWVGTLAAGSESHDASLLVFLEFAADKIEGPHHYWLNRMDKGTKFFFNDGVFLIVVDVFLHDSLVLGFNNIVLVERVKLLQQRFPELKVFGLQCGAHITDYNTKTQISKMITNEYITFPILVSSEKFVQMKDGTLYVLLNGLKEPVYYFPRNVELTNISKEIGQLVNPQKKSSSVLENFGSTWARCAEIVREPSVCSSLKNLLLDFAGCMSVDEPSNRIFLSDTNHHRIIIINGNGYILDSVSRMVDLKLLR